MHASLLVSSTMHVCVIWKHKKYHVTYEESKFFFLPILIASFLDFDSFHSQPGNQGNQWIIRKFENGLFFTEKSGNYQGILVEYKENQEKSTFSYKNIFQWWIFVSLYFQLYPFSCSETLLLLFPAMSIMLQPGFFF